MERIRCITYVIGDIHGCHDQLIEMLDWIEADADANQAYARIVYLGDYVDKGPKSRQVLETLIAGPRHPWIFEIFLLGNHDDLLIQVYRNPTSKLGMQWFKRGGQQTLESYGWEFGDALDIQALIPEDHIQFLERALTTCPALWDAYCVHAGFRPGVAIKEQEKTDLLWIRDDFLTSENAFGRPVIHGHSPTTVGHEQDAAGRINLDSHAHVTGILTCAVFETGLPMRIHRTAELALEQEMSGPSLF